MVVNLIMQRFRGGKDFYLGLECHDSVTSIDGSDKGVLVLDSNDITDGTNIKLGGNSGQQTSGECTGTSNNVTELELVL